MYVTILNIKLNIELLILDIFCLIRRVKILTGKLLSIFWSKSSLSQSSSLDTSRYCKATSEAIKYKYECKPEQRRIYDYTFHIVHSVLVIQWQRYVTRPNTMSLGVARIAQPYKYNITVNIHHYILSTSYIYFSVYILKNGPGYLSRYSDSLGLDGPGIESRWGWEFPQPSRPAPGAHPASCTTGTLSL
jgi:hypothetical protein